MGPSNDMTCDGQCTLHPMDAIVCYAGCIIFRPYRRTGGFHERAGPPPRSEGRGMDLKNRPDTRRVFVAFPHRTLLSLALFLSCVSRTLFCLPSLPISFTTHPLEFFYTNSSSSSSSSTRSCGAKVPCCSVCPNANKLELEFQMIRNWEKQKTKFRCFCGTCLICLLDRERERERESSQF